jgi:hypothetical protein
LKKLTRTKLIFSKKNYALNFFAHLKIFFVRVHFSKKWLIVEKIDFLKNFKNRDKCCSDRDTAAMMKNRNCPDGNLAAGQPSFDPSGFSILQLFPTIFYQGLSREIG